MNYIINYWVTQDVIWTLYIYIYIERERERELTSPKIFFYYIHISYNVNYSCWFLLVENKVLKNPKKETFKNPEFPTK